MRLKVRGEGGKGGWVWDTKTSILTQTKPQEDGEDEVWAGEGADAQLMGWVHARASTGQHERLRLAAGMGITFHAASSLGQRQRQVEEPSSTACSSLMSSRSRMTV